MSRKGFTLIEVLMIIIILAIIFMLLAPNLGIFTGRISERELNKQKDMVIKAANTYAYDRSNRYYNGNIGDTWDRVSVANNLRPDYVSSTVDSSIRYVCIPPTRDNSPCILGDEDCNC